MVIIIGKYVNLCVQVTPAQLELLKFMKEKYGLSQGIIIRSMLGVYTRNPDLLGQTLLKEEETKFLKFKEKIENLEDDLGEYEEEKDVFIE